MRAMVDLGKTVRSSKRGLRWFYRTKGLSNGWGRSAREKINVCEVIGNSEVKEGRRV